MAKIGSLSISLGLNTAEFNKNLSKSSKRVRRATRRMRKSFNRVNKSVMRMTGVVAALAGPAALGLLVKSSMKSIDANAKMADAINISTESLSALHTAAQLSGVETKTMDKAMVKMARSIRDADDGLATYIRSFDKLGLKAAELKELAPEEQFFTIQKALGGVTNATDRLAIATDLYGSRAATILNMTSLSFEAFQKLKEETIQVGKALDRIDSNKVEQANDSITKASDAVEGLGNRISVALSPFIKKMADDFYQAALDSDGFSAAVERGMKVAVTAVGYVLNTLRMLEIGWKTVNLGFQGVVAWIVNGWYTVAEAITNTLNLLPGVKIQMSESFKEIAEATKGVMEETYNELVELTSKPLPSEGLQKWADDAVEASNRAARAFVKNRKTIASAQSKMTKDEQKKNKKMLDLGKKSAEEQLGITKFNAAKEGIINLKSAVMGAYKWGAGIGGPIVGGLAAAAAFAFQSAQLADMGVGGGGGGSSSGGGGVSTPPTTSDPVEETTPQSKQTKQGDITNASAAEQTIQVFLDGDVILEAVNNGSRDGRLAIDANAVR